MDCFASLAMTALAALSNLENALYRLEAVVMLTPTI
jgi:hypothetical protein